jgi:UDP-N-acetyl-D-mannosaminuronic acid dehydrogenase
MGDRVSVHDAKVAILGFSFKANTDDLRDSLAPKLWRYVHRQLPAEVRVSDHNLPNPIPEPSARNPRNWPLSEVLDDVDIVFVATNHDEYYDVLRELSLTRPEVWVADIWNVGQVGEMFYQVGDITKKEGSA